MIRATCTRLTLKSEDIKQYEEERKKWEAELKQTKGAQADGETTRNQQEGTATRKQQQRARIGIQQDK
jgi:Anaphase-promoting complex APC subunit CDC26